MGWAQEPAILPLPTAQAWGSPKPPWWLGLGEGHTLFLDGNVKFYFFLQQMETVAEITTGQSTEITVCRGATLMIQLQHTPTPKARGTSWKIRREMGRARGPGQLLEDGVF